MRILLHLHSFLRFHQSPHIRAVNVVFLIGITFHIPCKLEVLFQQLAGICCVLILLSVFFRSLRQQIFHTIEMDPKFNKIYVLNFNQILDFKKV